MSETRVEVIGYGEFDAREWLRRDVLWASLMSPYSKQMEGWLDGGHPRSAGPRVEMLQPIFRQILDSETYQALTSS